MFIGIKNKHLSRLFDWLSIKMIKSAIFDIKLIVMCRPIFIIFLLLISVSANTYAQYTETINTNRPGTSQGAFSVGKNVIQFETGLVLGKEKHDLFDTKTNTSEFQYSIRVGLLLEQLEFGLEGSYLRLKSDEITGISDEELERKGFPFNALGVKYLIYDPYKYKKERSTNILSWKANRRINWKRLIPAVSAYLAANFTSSSGDFSFQNNPDTRATEVQPNITPKIVISAHNVWSDKMVFVMNLVSRNLNTEFPEYRFITTATYNYNDYWSFFGEYEGVSSDVYKDHLLKLGGAFLATPNLQFDMRVLGNFKDTPSIFNVGFGASYRLDYHKNGDNEYIDTEETHSAKKYVELIKKDIENGHLDKSTLTGKLQSVTEDGVIVERFKGIDLEEFTKEEEIEEEFGEDEEEVPSPKWWQIGKKRRLRKKASKDTTTTKAVAGLGRKSDFLDDEFIKQKQAEITPEERTPEELAEIALRNEKKNKKNKRSKNKNRSNQIYVDQVTGDSIPPPDYSSMSRKERKIAERKHKELFELDDLNDLVSDIEDKQSARAIKKEEKRKAKLARKAAKKTAKSTKKGKEPLDSNENNELVTDKDKNQSKNLEVKNATKQKEFESKKLLKEDKELQRLEAEIAKEEEKERKRKAKETKKLKSKKKKKKRKKGKEEVNID